MVVPVQFRSALLDDYDVSRGSAETIGQVQEYVKDLADHLNTGQGLLFIGPPGTGKTMVASALVNQAKRESFSADFIMMNSYLGLFSRKMELQPLLGRDDSADTMWWEADTRIQDLKKKMQFLVLDDVGKEYQPAGSMPTQWASMQFDHLLRFRYNAGLPSILTSNIPLSAWDSKYSESMSSFVHGSYIVVNFGGKDQRKALHAARRHQ